MERKNVFDYFLYELEQFTELDLETLKKVAELINQKGEHVSFRELGDLSGFDVLNGQAEGLLQILTGIVHRELVIDKTFDEELEKSKLKDKEKIKAFFEFLSDKGKKSLDVRYFIERSNVGDPVLEDIEQNTFLKEIFDDDKNLICYLPIIRLKFTFVRDDKPSIRYGYFPKEQLKNMIDSLQEIYDDSAKSIERYKNVRDTSLEIVGE